MQIHKLQEHEIRNLRRVFGEPIEKITTENAISFYSISPPQMSRKEEKNRYFCTTMGCMYNDNKNKCDFVTAAYKLYKKSTDSGKKNIRSIMDIDARTSLFLKQMATLVRKMASEGIFVDPDEMLKTITYWNENSKKRKKDFALMLVNGEE